MTRDRCGGSTIWPGRGNYSLCSQKRGGEHKNEIDNELLFLSKTLWYCQVPSVGRRPLLRLYGRNKRPVNRKGSEPFVFAEPTALRSAQQKTVDRLAKTGRRQSEPLVRLPSTCLLSDENGRRCVLTNHPETNALGCSGRRRGSTHNLPVKMVRSRYVCRWMMAL